MASLWMVLTLLLCQPPAEDEEALPAGAVQRLGSTRPGVSSYVTGLAFAPDGHHLLTSHNDPEARLWDLRSGKVVRSLTGHKERLWSVAYAPDGKTLATAGNDQTLGLWDARTGKRLHTLTVKTGAVRGVAFAPDSGVVAGASGNLLQSWFRAGGQIEHTAATAHTNTARCVAYGPDGKLLASGGDDQMVRIRSAATWKETNVCVGHAGPVRGIAFAPDGRLLASASDDRTVRIWSVLTGQTFRILRGHVGNVFGVAFAPHGQLLATASPDFTVRVWEVATGQEVRRFEGHRDWAVCVAFSPDGKRVASGSADHTVLIWQLDRPAAANAPKLEDADLKRLWTRLASDDAGQAFQALDALAAAPTLAIGLLAQKLAPVASAEAARVADLVVDLDSPRFAQRKRASDELERLGEVALTALLQTMEKKPSLEVRQRIKLLLEKVEGAVPSPERLRMFRSLLLLERIGSPDARAMLQKLAGGARESRLTQDARAALQRLERAS